MMVTPRLLTHLALLVVFYIAIVFDFIWWTLIQSGEVLSTEYDYIVIGGGSGGSTVAGRLAENGSFNVLVLEAGATSSPLNKIPILGMLHMRSPYDWQYMTEPQDNACLAMSEQRSFWPCGKILGGSSQLNFMMYVRGHPRDPDGWGEPNPGWSFRDIRPFFDRSITYAGEKSNLGENGPWQIVRGNGISYVDDMFVESGEKLGFKRLNINSEFGPGLYFTDAHQWNGYRHSPSDAFLQHRPNLDIVTNALVDKINFIGNRANSVVFAKFGETISVRAKREIIVSAGAVNTPTILLRSGVGPKQHLLEMGISQVVNLPVGENLVAHTGALLPYLAKQPSNLLPSTVFAATKEYVFNGTGHVAANMCNSGLFYCSSEAESAEWPDIQLMFGNFHPWIQGPGGNADWNLRQDLYDSVLPELNETTHGVSLFPYLLRPESRGFVRLASTDPTAPPVIQPNFLREDRDVRRLMEGLRLATRLAETPPLSENIVRPIILPPCRNLTGDSQLECQLRHLTLTVYHPASTCRMAPRQSGGVVDEKLRVHGLRGLRVMDASVMPNVTSGNTNAPVVMIAEKGADMILHGL